ncbi:unnamed protein product [Rotaria magnacalcarata]|uniref:G-protein coupled receptors family 1 profile domain-containing protein n=1 Tax=Rotaria magnacalcarata TaxID=392030 RepID=A0A814WSD7_9BILA|nr:unnamed protein product [Rotaria magnacalcarata]CAF1319392.1 unnamed protein product [Rotaria magnacalcarata]CAF1922081.1 unnamed protein product [Rotaria magnacalcarata]CAF3825206.1 unnamed protein product [Rotaria magnacalcarata]CAF4055887.1 unnamed protein product [Rotaria magnacalcarata]
MEPHEVIDSISLSVLISIILKSSIKYIICLCIIIINILLITSLLLVKRLRTAQNLLLINVCFACIFFSIACILSISLTISIIYTKLVNPYVCQFTGFLILSSSHGLMFSYTLVAFVRFLTIIYPFNKKISSNHYIKMYLIIKWILAFLLPTVSLILPKQQIIFQSKAQMCTISQQSPLLYIYFSTAFIIPFILISLMNLVTYLNVTRSRQMHLLSRTKQSRLNRRKLRNVRLLRQFSFFTIIFLIGWTPFIIIEVFDKRGNIPDIFYLFTLLLPLICILIDSNAILYWNKTIHHQIQLWWQSLIKKTEIINYETNISKHDHKIISINTNADISNI